MKYSLLLLGALLLTITGMAQMTTYSYNFNGNLHEQGGHGTDLTDACTGSYTTVALPIGISKKVYSFGHGCGIVFDDATTNLLADGSYTIEMYFELDTTSGYKKVIDYKGLGEDNGFYIDNGVLNLYPNYSSDSVLVTDSSYQYVAITRDATTQDMHVYYNGMNEGMYTDTGNDYIYAALKALTFFQDDSGTKTEETSGNVAMIHISNYAMDSTAVMGNYTSLASTLNVANTTKPNTVSIYPNPASSEIHVTTTATLQYTLCDITGTMLYYGVLQAGNNTVLLNKLAAGMYLLKATDGNGNDKVYKVLKQ